MLYILKFFTAVPDGSQTTTGSSSMRWWRHPATLTLVTPILFALPLTYLAMFLGWPT
jgi:hypothetical protein